LNVSISRYLQLPADRRQALSAAAEAEFSQFALVRETQWASPDWSYMAFEGDELVAFYNIVERTISTGDASVQVAGLSNLVTLPAHRGRGVASRLLRETSSRWIELHGTDCGLLLCADVLVPFYSRMKWERVEARVTYSQPQGSRTWTANCMLLNAACEASSIREIDLCGLPW
jgi:GNAT superfamily N-acetyltransferase